MKTSTKIAIGAFVLIVFVLPLGYYFYDQNQPGKLDQFTTCLKDKGATFYGAFWCPHCQRTKAMFGKSAKLLPYTECSLPSGSGQNKTCDDKGITGYPTWIFADNGRLNGELTLQQLADKTGCELPK